MTGDVAGPFTAPGLDDGGLDRTLAHAGVGTFVVAADKRITFWNQADEAIMSYTWRDSATPIWCFTSSGVATSGMWFRSYSPLLIGGTDTALTVPDLSI